jgi:hypothetical protein
MNLNIEDGAAPQLLRIRDRQFMTFFDDGTFLLASHGTNIPRSGVEHGFYNYDPVLGTLDFNVFSDASTQGGTYEVVTVVVDPTLIGVAYPASLSNTLGYNDFTFPGVAAPPARYRNNFAASGPNGGVARATNVTVNTGSPASISMTFSGVPRHATTGAQQGGGAVRTQTWTFTEPQQNAGQMTGAWVTADHRRVWVYNFTNTTGMHDGVNGPINQQDACFVFDDPEASTSFYTRRGTLASCMTLQGGALFGAPGVFFEYYQTGFGTLDCVPNKAAGIFTAHPGSCGTASLTESPPGYLGRFPGSQGSFDSRPPSPNTYTVSPGTPEVLTVQRTLNGDPLGAPVVFTRAQVKLD